jgi:hypothetical protein
MFFRIMYDWLISLLLDFFIQEAYSRLSLWACDSLI